jgi:sec-independent protein translocase protein TatA
MFGLGTGEIILILLIILIFFGAKKIPELAQGLGKGMKEFRKAARDIQDEIDTPGDQKKPDKMDKPDKTDKPA